jgi:hypothetical protein
MLCRVLYFWLDGAHLFDGTDNSKRQADDLSSIRMPTQYLGIGGKGTKHVGFSLAQTEYVVSSVLLFIVFQIHLFR